MDEIDFQNRAEEIVKMAEGYGVRISSLHLPFFPFEVIAPSDHDPAHRMTAIENLPRTCLGRESGEIRYLLDRIPTLRACFDINHCLGEDNVHFIRALGYKIVTLHVSDYDFVDERHWLPGEEKNDWKAILTALQEVGYAGRFLYEVKSQYTFRQVADNYRALMTRIK